jgi:hypothetical protein
VELWHAYILPVLPWSSLVALADTCRAFRSLVLSYPAERCTPPSSVSAGLVGVQLVWARALSRSRTTLRRHQEHAVLLERLAQTFLDEVDHPCLCVSVFRCVSLGETDFVSFRSHTECSVAHPTQVSGRGLDRECPDADRRQSSPPIPVSGAGG